MKVGECENSGRGALVAPLIVTVDVAAQRMTATKGGRVVGTWPVSTARAGVGGEEGSGKTPPGRHRVCARFGARAPLGQVFVSRRAVKGRVLAPADWADGGEGDLVLSRILWLEGLEEGVNRGPGVDSRARYIYIHGTNHEARLGTPASHGCIRMGNRAVAELFALVRAAARTEVVIV